MRTLKRLIWWTSAIGIGWAIGIAVTSRLKGTAFFVFLALCCAVSFVAFRVGHKSRKTPDVALPQQEPSFQKHVLLSAYDDWFLRPLDIISVVLALAYLYHRAWLLGLFLLVFGNLLAMVGQALNREQSSKELAHKRRWLTAAEFVARTRNKLDGWQAVELRKATVGTWAALALAATLVALHHGLKVYLAIPLGISFGFVCQVLFFLEVGLVCLLYLPSRSSTRKAARRESR